MASSESHQSPRRDLGLASTSREALLNEFQAKGFDMSESAGLFVGVRSFSEDPGLTEIPFAADDAVDLAWAFCAGCGLLPPNKVTFCLSGDPQKEESRRKLEALQARGANVGPALRSHIFQAIERSVRATGPNGMILCSLATHGFQQDGSDYFLAADSIRVKARQTALMLKDLEEDLRTAPTRRQLLLIDTCREKLDAVSSRRVGGGMSDSLSQAISKVEGVVVLSATGAGGFAYDDPTAGNGVFTRAILDGLAGQATPGNDGLLRAKELADFVHNRVIEWVSKNQPHTAAQAGIQRNISGAGADLPLALDLTVYNQIQQTRGQDAARMEGARTVLGQALGLPGFSGQLIDAVLNRLKSSTGQEKEGLLRRLEKLGHEKEDYADDFLAWWEVQSRRNSQSSNPMITPLQVAPAPLAPPGGVYTGLTSIPPFVPSAAPPPAAPPTLASPRPAAIPVRPPRTLKKLLIGLAATFAPLILLIIGAFIYDAIR